MDLLFVYALYSSVSFLLTGDKIYTIMKPISEIGFIKNLLIQR